jgi:hypothetical protein
MIKSGVWKEGRGGKAGQIICQDKKKYGKQKNQRGQSCNLAFSKTVSLK